MSPQDGDDASLADDSEMALTGINMLLNNGYDEARALFEKYKNESPLMQAGYSFVYFMQALMSFEEEKLAEALKILQETEKKCEVSDGFVKSMKRKLSKKKKQSANSVGLEDKLQRQIIVADSLLYQSILTFTNQDIPSYMKGGWYLRKAWKIYEKLHKEINNIRNRQIQSKIQQMQASLPPTVNGNVSNSSNSSKEEVVDGNSNELSEQIVARLLGSVNFGYGTFQLCISIMPPKILKLIEFLGFEGDREAGLNALDFTSHSEDMKAPLATLGLLWYHTVLRPFFAVDGANGYSAGTSDAEAIIASKEKDFPNSSLFLFFRGRIHRLRVETDASITMYRRAFDEAKGQREIELMCLYEISWCNLMRLQWKDCLDGFGRLAEESKWSKAYYSYLRGICIGAMGELKEAHSILKEVPGQVKKKNNQIEAFVLRRGEKLKKQAPSQEFCRLLALELMFLWHAIPTCTEAELKPMLDVCDMQTDHKALHIKSLVEGAIFKELGQEDMAVAVSFYKLVYQDC
ncbi:hypothetical protein LOTGIDRAFT_143837 [Lottia gigantea]|uniref:Tetratricopeptide repeat protein 39C n=1 Tax=Lottia gigantea TaxID=225164 RepID=V3ZYK9_LOTGI|nr:hypothetical protein LOTGIDRAFT_143837 [Lottia gigantea]ESO96618.1 hypothetical protein LOTGIDRAFT_143837 [Lottia gigantea]